MNRAIIASSMKDIALSLELTVKNSGFSNVGIITGGCELRRMMRSDSPPELIIIAAPLADEFGHELALDAALETESGIIFICPGDIAHDMTERLSCHGIEVLTSPTSRESLSAAIERAAPSEGELKESSDILSRIDDIRLINKAKTVLMKYLKFTEPQAHRYIEKQAMNNRCTRREAAENIINTYK